MYVPDIVALIRCTQSRGCREGGRRPGGVFSYFLLVCRSRVGDTCNSCMREDDLICFTSCLGGARLAATRDDICYSGISGLLKGAVVGCDRVIHGWPLAYQLPLTAMLCRSHGLYQVIYKTFVPWAISGVIGYPSDNIRP